MAINMDVINNLFNIHIGIPAGIRHEIALKFKMLNFNINLDCSDCIAHILELRILYAINIVAVSAIVKSNSEMLSFKPIAFLYFEIPRADVNGRADKYSGIT